MNVTSEGAGILVGIDFSESCIRALLRAVTIAESVADDVGAAVDHAARTLWRAT